MSRNLFMLLVPVQFGLFIVGCTNSQSSPSTGPVGRPIHQTKTRGGLKGSRPGIGGVSDSESNSNSDSDSDSSADSSDSTSPTKGKATVGESCKSGDSNHLCLGVKYVVYKDTSEGAVVKRAGAVSDIDGINQVWSKCNIGFQIDEYLEADPNKDGLAYQPANDGELSDIRSAYADKNTLLVVTTGTWNRSGSLGSTGANAWTSMPGDSPYGAVLEKPVGTFAYIIAHELGHYLGLMHIDDPSDLMNPIIYNNSTVLSEDQCGIARNTASSYWQRVVR